MAFLDEVFTQRRFGPGRVLVEQCLTGPEVSVFAAIIDDQYLIFTPARDYKRAHDGDLGPNTGGMGAVASRQLVSQEMLDADRTGNRPADRRADCAREGLPYRGFLYFGLMLTPTGPQVIEYNCRFGDPECQAVMPLVRGRSRRVLPRRCQWRTPRRSHLVSDDGWSVCVILASAGYPETSRNGDKISGLENITDCPRLSLRHPQNRRWRLGNQRRPRARRRLRRRHPRGSRQPRPTPPPISSPSTACNAAATSASSIFEPSCKHAPSPQKTSPPASNASPRRSAKNTAATPSPSSASAAAATKWRSGCSTILSEEDDWELSFGVLDISLYRDDFEHLHENPTLQESDIAFPVEGAHIILVDDVLFTGRTIRAALDALSDYGRPAKVELAVLIDRGHREMPIQPDYVGITLDTRRLDHVLVSLEGTDGVDQVQIVEKENP